MPVNEIDDLKKKLQEAKQVEKQQLKQQQQQVRQNRKAEIQKQKAEKRKERDQRKQEKQSRREQIRQDKELRKKQVQEEKRIQKELLNKKKDAVKDTAPKIKKTEKEIQKEEKMPQPDLLPFTLASGLLPIKKVHNGIIQTTDDRYVKLVEILPINFSLRSSTEKRNIINAYNSYLKIAPSKLQIKVISKKADTSEYIRKIQEEIQNESDENCRMLQHDYIRLIQELGAKEAITRRFFLIFEYEDYNKKKAIDTDIQQYFKTVVQTAKKYLLQCQNILLEHENDTRFVVETWYQILNRHTSLTDSLDDRIRLVTDYYLRENGEESIKHIPVSELIAPVTVRTKNRNYIEVDDLYYSFLYIPGDKYRSRVPAGWLSLIINAGEGIDVDMFIFKQDKTRAIERIGRKIRLNRSKIRDTNDTSTDFDDLSDSIHSGYYLKRGLGAGEDFYYVATLITIIGHTPNEVDWRAKEMAKLLHSQDIGTQKSLFRMEQAFLSSLPLLNLDKKIYQQAKQNMLTSSVAACYPYTSFEMSDKDGILMGVNKLNSSMVIVDIFNSQIYKNSNITILGTSGAGKTFLMQLMALRMRRKNVQVFLIAPDKGHEFARACRNTGGAYIKLSPASKTCINVMEIRKIDYGTSDLLDGGEHSSQLATKIQSLHIFFAILIPDMDYEEKQLLDEAMVITYRNFGILHENSSLYDPKDPTRYKTMPILGDLHAVLMQKKECHRIANILNRLVNGSASSFNAQTNVDLDNMYCVLDISELRSDLALGMYVAIDYVWQKAKEDRIKEKAIYIDEAWRLLMSNELAGEYLLEIFKTIRAFGGSAVCASQDLMDFFALKDGKYGRGILNNSKTKILLNMEIAESERIKEELDLSEAEATAITRFERGTGLISANNNNMIVDFRASQLEKDLITTDRTDLKKLKERLEKYGDQAYVRYGGGA